MTVDRRGAGPRPRSRPRPRRRRHRAALLAVLPQRGGAAHRQWPGSRPAGLRSHRHGARRADVGEPTRRRRRRIRVRAAARTGARRERVAPRFPPDPSRQSRGARLEVALLGDAERAARRQAVVRPARPPGRRPCSSRWARTASTRWCPASAGSASAAASCSSPAAGPWTIATATMRLRVTIGPGATVCSSSYRPRIWRQSVSSERAASSCTAAIAACSWYGPIGALASASVIRRDPLGDGRRVPAAAVLLGERDQRAVRAGPRRTAGVGQQHQREQPGDLAVVGQALAQLPGQADRLARQLDPMQRRARSWRCSPR